MERPGRQDVMSDVLPGLIRRVVVLAVADLAVVVHHLPERDDVAPRLSGLRLWK